MKKTLLLLCLFFLIYFNSSLTPRNTLAQSCCTAPSDCPPLEGYVALCVSHNAACNPNYQCTYEVSSEACTLATFPPYEVGAPIMAEISGPAPITYSLFVNPEHCTLPSTMAANSSFAINCTQAGTYIINATSNTSSCSLTFIISPSECIGEVSGFPGDCALMCGPDRSADPQGASDQCPPSALGVRVDKCCIDNDLLGGQGSPCVGLSSGEIGSCLTFCGPYNEPDGSNPPDSICSSGQKCCLRGQGVLAEPESPLGGGNCGPSGLNTAIGCVPVNDSTSLLSFILRWGMGIGGGIAFVLIVVAGFQITTSSGDPKRLQAGRELLTAAIMGLVLLIFSAFILRLIGVDILQIPGL